MNRNLKLTLATLTFATASWLSASAVPAYPKPITVTQPDGTQVTILLKGDERTHWLETTDGYTLLRDQEGFLAFAERKEGKMVASTLRYDGTTTAAQQQGFTKGLRPTATAATTNGTASPQRAQADTDKLLVDQTFPTKGKRKLLCLLVNFADTQTSFTRDDFQRMMNQEGYKGIGSFHDYYMEQSGGQLDIDVTVTDWIQLPYKKSLYGVDDMTYLIQDALDLVTDTLSLSQFDNDGDGILDGLAIIHQGTGQEASADGNDIWSHSSSVYGLKYNGVSVTRYTIEPELLYTGYMSNIGVLCHEFGHNLGAPDFYDSDYESSGGEFCGTGVWDLLGSGAWNGNYGDRPAGINAWQKWVYGWLEPEQLSADTTITNLEAADVEQKAFRFETGTPGEYIILENRQQNGTFDSALPGHGLIAYHVNENIIKNRLSANTINATYPQGIYTVCADAGVDPDSQPSSFGNVNSNGAPFPGFYGHSEFGDNTLPSTKSAEGRMAYCALQNITDSDGRVSFTFVKGDAPAQPENLVATTKSGDVTLTWTMPDTVAGVKEYTIYRNDEKLGTTTSTTYLDEAPDGGTLLTYQVDATYDNGLVSHPSETSIMVPTNRLNKLTATPSTNHVELSWTTNNKLTWSNASNGKLTTQDVTEDEVEFANHFTAADLSTYVGGRITKMSFLPTQGPSVLTVKFRVYEANADGTGLTLVSERNVKEFANGQAREVSLTKSVTIQEGKDYYVAVNCVSSNGTVTLTSDQDAVVSGRGNCRLRNGEFVADASALGNYYVTATVTPASESGTAEVEIPTDCDAATDLFFPLAFAVYRDSTLIGTTTARSFADDGVSAGNHTYAVTCLYAGMNESAALSQAVTVDGDVTAIQSATINNPANETAGAWFTLTGVRIAKPSQPGVYVKDGRKVVVR